MAYIPIRFQLSTLSTVKATQPDIDSAREPVLSHPFRKKCSAERADFFFTAKLSSFAQL